MTCPICSDWKYKSLVKTCPICGGEGGLNEVRDLATDFMKLWETGTFEQIWEAIPDRTTPLPENGVELLGL